MKTIFAMFLAAAFLLARPAFAADEAPKGDKKAEKKKDDKKDEKKEEKKADKGW
jgi:ribosomal protein L12E/L44/L45/RPP1/RPP2